LKMMEEYGGGGGRWSGFRVWLVGRRLAAEKDLALDIVGSGLEKEMAALNEVGIGFRNLGVGG